MQQYHLQQYIVLYQRFIVAQKAKKLFCQSATISDEPVILLLTILTLQVEKKPLLSLLSIESSPGSEEGSCDQQMTPELLNEAFSVKATW